MEKMLDFEFTIYLQDSCDIPFSRVFYEGISHATAESLASAWMSEGYFVRPYNKDDKVKTIVRPYKISIKVIN